MPENNNTTDRIRRHTRVVWAMFVLFPIILFIVAERFTVNREMPPAESFEPILIFGIVMSCFATIAALVLHHWLPGWLSKFRPRGRSGPIAPLLRKNANPETTGTGQAATSISSVVMIVLNCLAVSVTMYGMVIVLAGGELWTMVPFAVVSLLLVILFRPSEAFFRRVTEKLDDRRGDRTK